MKKFFAALVVALSMPFAVLAAEGETTTKVEEMVVTSEGNTLTTPPAVVVQDELTLTERFNALYEGFVEDVKKLLEGDQADAKAKAEEVEAFAEPEASE